MMVKISSKYNESLKGAHALTESPKQVTYEKLKFN